MKLEMQDGMRNKHEAGEKKKNQSKASKAQASDQLTDTSYRPRERRGKWNNSQSKKWNVKLAISLYSASLHEFFTHIWSENKERKNKSRFSWKTEITN